MDNASLCYKDGPQLPSLNFTTNCLTFGRYVTFYNERLTGATYPQEYQQTVYTEICEVIVQGRKKIIILPFYVYTCTLNIQSLCPDIENVYLSC